MKQITFNESDLRKIFRTPTRVSRFIRFLRRLIANAVLIVVVFFVLFYAINGPAFWQRFTYATQPRAIIEPPPPPPPPAVMYDPRIQITKIGINAPVIYNVGFDEIIPRLQEGVVHYGGTAVPGQVGNVVLFGHSSDYPWSTGQYKTIFALLDKLVIGDEIVLPFQSERYVYRVTETNIVRPTDLSVLHKTATPMLTLITCYPVGTAQKRLVIRAELSSGKITGDQTTEPNVSDRVPTPR